jgi:hypothetical protein
VRNLLGKSTVKDMHLPARTPHTRSIAVLAVLLAAGVAVALGSAGPASAGPKYHTYCSPKPGPHSWEKAPAGVKNPEKYANCEDCRPIASGTKCELWYGGQTSDGGEGGVSHKGWPGLTGIRWQVTDDSKKAGRTRDGTALNDGLYGRHGSDTLRGGNGDDILWGDSKISKANGPKQKDVLDGGDGDDWIYASHGKNTITGGDGDDTIIAYYGKGTIDCGPGQDTVTVLKKTPYTVKNCETVKHPGKG